ncbi:MAG: hypothetical protein R3Y64_02015 [Peptostreptococcaceae bacterium]
MKDDGFMLVECIVSLSLVLLVTILIQGVLVNSFSFDQEDKIKILNISKSSLDKAKNEIKSDMDYEKFSIEVIDDFIINKEIEENEYYKKININVESKNDSFEVSSYVYK